MPDDGCGPAKASTFTAAEPNRTLRARLADVAATVEKRSEARVLRYQVANYDGCWTEYGNTVGLPINNPAGSRAKLMQA